MPEASNENTPADPLAESTEPVREGKLARLVHWGHASNVRKAIVAGLFIALFGGMFAIWSYLAHLAVSHEEQYTLARALAALDNNEYEQAKNIIGEMQKRGADEADFGGALFVLGSVKAAQAEQEWSKDRQRAMHLIAARYLQKARELGVPERLENVSRFMVGKSLVLGNQPQAGIEVLEGLLKDTDEESKTPLHVLLAQAYQEIPEPNLSAALSHNQAVLNDSSLDAQRRNEASITQADILGRMGRLEEAGQFIKFAGSNDAQRALINSIASRIALEQAKRLPTGSDERVALANRAISLLREAKLLDPLNSKLTRQAIYWIGKSYEIEGNQEAAIRRYDQLSKSYGDTPESLTATLDKADLVRNAQKPEEALASYRNVLTSVGDPRTYVNRLLPISALRKRLKQAHDAFIEAGNFQEAMALLDSFQPVFSLAETTEIRALAHRKWAEALGDGGTQAMHSVGGDAASKAKYHHRAAGTAYELLSKLRYATREFTDDLWNSADNYFQGQSYTHAQRMYENYLQHEAQKRQALALLRLGQCQLAQGEQKDAITTLEECIEMHPRDATIYQARIECAHALLQLSQGEQAEQLLYENLVGGKLDPKAKEWLDSLFLLGEYLHNSERYTEAIQKLDEAVLRFDQLDQATLSAKDLEKAMFARYTIARSFHKAAEKPTKLAREAKTESERQKNRKERDKNLNQALENYLQVQRMLTLQGHVDNNELSRTLLRNCYMMQGSVLFDLKLYEEARKAYANISTLYQNEPFVMESFVHIANCYRRLNKPVKAKGTIEQAKLVLNRFPAETDFKIATNFSRKSWELLLNEMSGW